MPATHRAAILAVLLAEPAAEAAKRLGLHVERVRLLPGGNARCSRRPCGRFGQAPLQIAPRRACARASSCEHSTGVVEWHGARWPKRATSPVCTPISATARRRRATVAVRAQELFEHADGVLDTADIERVHDMRVATRRLRAVLEIFAPCFPRKEHARRPARRQGAGRRARRAPRSRTSTSPRSRSSPARVTDADRPGVEVFAERVRARAGARATRCSPPRWPPSSRPTCAGACRAERRRVA